MVRRLVIGLVLSTITGMLRSKSRIKHYFSLHWKYPTSLIP